MDDPTALPEIVRRLADDTLGGRAHTPVALRRAVADRSASRSGATRSPGQVPEDLVAFVDKVTQHAYKIVDEDFERLRGAGYSEDELFEITVAAALGASLGRFERGLQALQEARGRR